MKNYAIKKINSNEIFYNIKGKYPIQIELIKYNAYKKKYTYNTYDIYTIQIENYSEQIELIQYK